jgi:CHAT domain-containing protein
MAVLANPDVPKPEASSPGAAIFGDSRLAELDPIPQVVEEARAILGWATAEESLRAFGPEATRGLLFDPVLTQYRVVHVAAHGLFDEHHPELSGLVMADGLVRAWELYRLHLPVDLVVLSACQTALGEEMPGEGLVGLARGFMYAGAPRVLVSLWQVSDASTAHLMSDLYRAHLREGLAPSAALRAAQLAYRRAHPEDPPYYWAPFVLLGDWRPPS